MVEPLRSRLLFKTITFSDRNFVELEEDNIVVFVGPNDSGKSETLRELEAWVPRSMPELVEKGAAQHNEGCQNDLRTYLEINAQKSDDGADLYFGEFGYIVRHSHSHLGYIDNSDDRHLVAPFFTNRMATEGWITDSNAAAALPLHQNLCLPSSSDDIELLCRMGIEPSSNIHRA